MCLACRTFERAKLGMKQPEAFLAVSANVSTLQWVRALILLLAKHAVSTNLTHFLPFLTRRVDCQAERLVSR